MRKKVFATLLGIFTGVVAISCSTVTAKALSGNSPAYAYETESASESNEFDIEGMVESGTFDSSKLTKKQIAYIEEKYDGDPQAIKELQKQSDYNSSPSLYADFGTFTHDSQFDGYDVINGIDVSRWNGDIDWTKVKASGIDFVIIRVALRTTGSGTLEADALYKQNLSGAIAAGLDVGVYIYSQAITVAEAKAEANYAISLIKGYNITLPVVMDYEYYTNNSGRLADAHLSVAQATKICNAFCSTVESKSYTPMVYANKSLLTNDVNAASIAKKYQIWLAQYPGYDSETHTIRATYTGKYSFWQYSSSGSVPGISGNVDMNLRYIKKPSTVTGLTRKDATMKSITLSWTKVPYVYGYQIYRYNKETDTYERLVSLKGSGRTSYTDTDITLNSMYSYKIRAYYKLANGNYYGGFSTVLNALPDQKPIENVKVSEATASSLKISWPAQSEITGYRIARYNPDTSKYTAIATISSADTTSYVDTDLTSGTTYKYKVQAYYEENGARAYFNYSEAVSYSTLPAKVTGLTQTKNTKNSIKLKWDTQDVVTGYKLYMLNTSTNTWKKIATLKGSTKNTYTVTGLKTNKKYQFSAIAYYTVNKKSGTTKRSETLTAYTSPADITGLSGKPLSTTSVKLNWNASKSVTGYKVYMKDPDTKKWKCVSIIEGKATTSYKQTDLTANQTYDFRIRAYRVVNNTTYYSSYQNISVCTTASAVKKVTLRKNGSSYLLTWKAQKNVAGYYIYSYNEKTNKYTKLATVKGAYYNIYIASKAQSSKNMYCVAPYITYSGKKYKGEYSSPATVAENSVTCTVSQSLVNVRKNAGQKYAVVTSLKSGKKVNIIGVKYAGTKRWYKVSFKQSGKTVTGYIRSDLVTIK